jgi:hypothetical protein
MRRGILIGQGKPKAHGRRGGGGGNGGCRIEAGEKLFRAFDVDPRIASTA